MILLLLHDGPGIFDPGQSPGIKRIKRISINIMLLSTIRNNGAFNTKNKTMDLKLNYPTVAAEETALTNFFSERKGFLSECRYFPDYQGRLDSMKAISRYLRIEPFTAADISAIIVCNSANHSLSCLLETLKNDYTTIITEPFTYPAFRTIAGNYGFRLLPGDFDSGGLTLESLQKIYEETNSRLLYLQPTIHNPTCTVMPLSRREEIAAFARKNNILIIEDDAYRFLHPNPPLRFLDLLPENTFHIFSLSKPFNPFIKTSYLITPIAFKNAVTECVRLNSSGHSSLLSDMAAHIMESGILEEIIFQKQNLAAALQKRLLPLINNLSFQTFATSFHIWIKLPETITSDRLVVKLLEKGIMVSNGKDFRVGNECREENYIRISLGAEHNIDNIEKALLQIVSIIEN